MNKTILIVDIEMPSPQNEQSIQSWFSGQMTDDEWIEYQF